MITLYTVLLLVAIPSRVSGHASIWHPSMWGFNVTGETFPYDNRPVSPLTQFTFDQWWFHGHMDFPPPEGQFFELPAGQSVNAEVACDKDATSFFKTGSGEDIQRGGNNPCPGSPISAVHTLGEDDLKGCALAITYESDEKKVQPEDFAIFSVQHQCVWTKDTPFEVPKAMPACPPGGCICAWFWVHSVKSGSEQNYMNAFRCNVTGVTSTAPIAKAQVPRRCGADPENGKLQADMSNCTYGAKQPFYWLQKERNNMFEDQFTPPYYTELYNFVDGAQNDIFVNGTNGGGSPSPSTPSPGPNSVQPASSASSTPNQPIPSDTPASDSSPSATPTPSSTGIIPGLNLGTCKRNPSSIPARRRRRSLPNRVSASHSKRYLYLGF